MSKEKPAAQQQAQAPQKPKEEGLEDRDEGVADNLGIRSQYRDPSTKDGQLRWD